ncbi:G5 domain-containing protein [Geobacillus jurassicus]|uniref:G5 domain-containing protein n=1 Tax=Geobacillus jurassicus TaxID=235932 RepID=A0ABV6GR90_9BACL|nr:G5 domain-containing protein [Geobacillus jurassicus]
MKKAAAWKLFVVMAVCTVYFITFSHLGTFAYDALASDDGRLGPGTAVGPVSLSGMTPERARQAVAERVNEWRATVSIPLQYQEKRIDLPADAFAFRLAESTKRFVDGRRTPLFVAADLEKCLQAAAAVVPPSALEALDVKRLGADLEELAAQLQTPSSSIDLARYISFTNGRQPVVSEAAASVPDSSAVRWLSRERRAVIKAKQMFSFGDYMKKAGAKLSDEAVDAIASAVYQAVLTTNFAVVERYTSRTLPQGITPGFEAAISSGRDLEWLNPNTTDYTLLLRYDGRKVRVAIIGLPFAYQYIIRLGEAESIEPRVIVRYDARLAPGEKRTEQIGRPGLVVTVEREVRDGARLVRKETVSEDFYPPTYTINVRGLEVPDGQRGDGEGGAMEPTNGVTENNGAANELDSTAENSGGKESETAPKKGDEAGKGESAPAASSKEETETGGGEEK